MTLPGRRGRKMRPALVGAIRAALYYWLTRGPANHPVNPDSANIFGVENAEIEDHVRPARQDQEEDSG